MVICHGIERELVIAKEFWQIIEKKWLLARARIVKNSVKGAFS